MSAIIGDCSHCGEHHDLNVPCQEFKDYIEARDTPPVCYDQGDYVPGSEMCDWCDWEDTCG